MGIRESSPFPVRIGLISDTHGLLRPAAMDFLRGCDHIIHAGDVGDPDILDALAALAPLTTVRGNIDKSAWADRLPETARLDFDGVRIEVIHDLAALKNVEKVDVVISGHSHKSRVERRGGVLYLNPGAAGPRRFKLPISLGDLTIERGALTPRIIELAP